MASSVRFDTSAKYLQELKQQAAHTSLSQGKEAALTGSQQLSGAGLSEPQRAPSYQSSSTQLLTKQFRSSPVKHTPSASINSNATTCKEVPVSRQSPLNLRRSEQNALASHLFQSSDDGEADDFQATTSDNYAMGEEDGGDPTCGDSDFEPAEQSVRVAPLHLQHKGGTHASSYFELERNHILMSQYEFDQQHESLLHSASNANYQDAIDYKLAGEHELSLSQNQFGGDQRPTDNSDVVYRLRGSQAQQDLSRTNYQSGYQNKNNLELSQNQTQSHNQQPYNTTKNLQKSPGASSSNRSPSGSPHQSALQNKSSTTRNKYQATTFEAAKGGVQQYKSKQADEHYLLPVDASEDDDIDEDMMDDDMGHSTLKASTQKPVTAANVALDSIKTSTNVRRFARNTGTYQSSFSKQMPATVSHSHNENSGGEFSADSEAEQFQFNKQQQRYKHDSSYSSEENDILLNPDFKSQYYVKQEQMAMSDQPDLEMKEIKRKTWTDINLTKDEDPQKDAPNQEQTRSQMQKQAASNLQTLKDKSSVQAAMNNRWVEEQEEADLEDSSRFKSTAVGFSPSQPVYSFNSSASALAQTQGAKNPDQKNVPTNDQNQPSKSLTSFGWRQDNESTSATSVKKKNSPTAAVKPTATLETATSARENQYRSSTVAEHNLSHFEQASQFGQYAMLYPPKSISKETWETQNKNMQGSQPVPATSSQKEKRKKKKEVTPEAHFLLTGSLATHLENRSFFRNTEDKTSKTQKGQQTVPPQSEPLPKDACGREALMEWFESLSLQDRVNSLTTTYPLFVASIIDAKQKHVRQNGPLCLFTIKKEKTIEASSADAAAVRRRQGTNSQQTQEDLTILERVMSQDDHYRGHNNFYSDQTSVRSFQTKIIKFIRLTSNKSVMDTLTVCPQLVRDSQEFFSLLENLTDGKAFSQPITYVTRHGSGGKPLIQSPRWIDSKKSNYLGVWIVAILEETLWAHFNFARQVNISSGVRKNELNQLFELRSENLQNQEDLAKRWTELAEKGQQKLISQLSQTAKEEPPSKFQTMYDEQERRNPGAYGTHVHQTQAQQYNEDIFSFCNNARGFGLYSFTEVPVRQHTDIYRSDLDGGSYYTSSNGAQGYLEQQGLAQITATSSKNGMMFMHNDKDLKEIIDVMSYVGALDFIKYLSEIPMQEVDQRNYIRKHYLCRQLHLMIQADLRQSIQDQLMNELLAIDSNPNSAKDVKTGDNPSTSSKNKKKPDNRKNKRNNQSGNGGKGATVAAQTQQVTQAYQKKKQSISKSPIRAAATEIIQAVSQQTSSILQSQKNDTTASKEKEKNVNGQKQTTGNQAKSGSEVKQAASRVASTTTSDDQHSSSTTTKPEQPQVTAATPSTQPSSSKKAPSQAQPKNRNNKKQAPSLVQQAKAQTAQPDPASEIAAAKASLAQVSLDAQAAVLKHVRLLLGDLVESVCVLEAERQEAEILQHQQLLLQSELEKQEAHQQVVSSEPASVPTPSREESDSEKSSVVFQQPETSSVVQLPAEKEPTPAVHQSTKPASEQPDKKPSTQQQQSSSSVKQEDQPSTSSKRPRRRKTQKKQDPEELVNNFMRKINGADNEDIDSSSQYGKQNNRNKNNNGGDRRQGAQQTAAGKDQDFNSSGQKQNNGRGQQQDRNVDKKKQDNNGQLSQKQANGSSYQQQSSNGNKQQTQSQQQNKGSGKESNQDYAASKKDQTQGGKSKVAQQAKPGLKLASQSQSSVQPEPPVETVVEEPVPIAVAAPSTIKEKTLPEPVPEKLQTKSATPKATAGQPKKAVSKLLMSETQTMLVFNIENQPNMIQESFATFEPSSVIDFNFVRDNDQVISLMAPSFVPEDPQTFVISPEQPLQQVEETPDKTQKQVEIKIPAELSIAPASIQASGQQQTGPVKISLTEHFNHPAMNLSAFCDFKTMDDIFGDKIGQNQQLYENSQIRFIDYTTQQQPSKVLEQDPKPAGLATPYQWQQPTVTLPTIECVDKPETVTQVKGVMSTTSVSFTPTLQISSPQMSLHSDANNMEATDLAAARTLSAHATQQDQFLMDQNLSPPLSKYNSTVPPTTTQHQNFFGQDLATQSSQYNLAVPSQQKYPPGSQVVSGFPPQSSQTLADQQPQAVKAQHYSTPYQQRGDYHIPKGSLYKKQQAPFRQQQPQYQAQQQFQPTQFGNKSPTSQQSDHFLSYQAPDLGSQGSSGSSYHSNQRSKNLQYAGAQGKKYSPEHGESFQQTSQQAFYQPFGGSPTQHDTVSQPSTIKTPQIRLDAPSFEPVVYRSQSDAPSNHNSAGDFRKLNWNQLNFGGQPQTSQFISPQAQKSSPDLLYPAQGNSGQYIDNNQHPLFLQLEDQFYRNFDKDIEKTSAKIQATIESYEEERMYVLKKLQTMANVAFPNRNPTIKVFGSLMTGLALETSDMDIAVTGLRIDGREDMIDDLHALAHQVQTWPLIKDFKAIETASIPVIKAQLFYKDIAREMGKPFLEDDDAQLPIDITFDDSPAESAIPQPPIMQHSQSQPNYNQDYNANQMQNNGAQTGPMNVVPQHQKMPADPMTQLQNLISGELGFNIQDSLIGYGMDYGGPPPPKTHLGLASCKLLKDYVRNYPYLKEVSVLLKRFLAVNNLNQSYLGGISSYSAVLLIVAYMNNFKLHLSPHLTPSRLLMGFLDFYSNCFDPRHFGVNTSKGMSFYQLPQVNQHMFVIVDPVNLTNNTARNSFRTADVLSHFRAAFFSLKSQITKQFQKQMAQAETERALKSEQDLVRLQADSEKALGASGQQPSKVEKPPSGDGSGHPRSRAVPHSSKKNNAQASQVDPTAAKASEQQQPSSNAAGSNSATTQGFLFPAKAAAGASAQALLAQQPAAQAFDSVNFVDCFLSPDILHEGGTDKQANVVEALSGFRGALAF